MDLYCVIMTLNRSIMLLPRRRVDWICDDETVIQMNLQQYVFRAFLEDLLDNGTTKEELDKVLEQMHIDDDERPTGEPYAVRFY